MVVFNVVLASGAAVGICMVDGVAGIVVAVCLVTCHVFLVVCVVTGVVDMVVVSVGSISALVVDDVVVTAVLVITFSGVTFGFAGAVIA